MNQINTRRLNTPWGDMILGSYRGKICLCDWLNRSNRESVDRRIQSGLKAEFVGQNDDLLEHTARQLQQYLKGQRKKFDLPVLTVGTSFQDTVWKALQQVPYGKTRSYRQLANIVNRPTAVRAVAAANGANALSILIPCHRVIGSNGQLTGYAGGLEAKAGLLALESGQ